MDEMAINMSSEVLEPLSDWLHVQPSSDDERAGRIYLPDTVSSGRLERSMILAVGDEVSDLSPGDIVLVLGKRAIDLRDGSRLVQRDNIVARVQG